VYAGEIAGAAGAAGGSAAWPAWSQTKIDFFFPVPVEGKLAREMTRLTKVYNDSQKEVQVTAVYTGSYDETKLKEFRHVSTLHRSGGTSRIAFLPSAMRQGSSNRRRVGESITAC